MKAPCQTPPIISLYVVTQLHVSAYSAFSFQPEMMKMQADGTVYGGGRGVAKKYRQEERPITGSKHDGANGHIMAS